VWQWLEGGTNTRRVRPQKKSRAEQGRGGAAKERESKKEGGNQRGVNIILEESVPTVRVGEKNFISRRKGEGTKTKENYGKGRKKT